MEIDQLSVKRKRFGMHFHVFAAVQIRIIPDIKAVFGNIAGGAMDTPCTHRKSDGDLCLEPLGTSVVDSSKEEKHGHGQEV